MEGSARKLIGTLLLVLFICIYAFFAMSIAEGKLREVSGLWKFVFYVVAGFAWVIPAGFLITWMARGSRPKA